MQRPLKNIFGIIVGAAALNYVFTFLLGDIAFNIGRVFVCLIGGWLVVASGARSLWLAAAVGPLVLLIDHVLFKGGYFLIAHFFFPATVNGQGLMSVAGVLLSYFMFSPIAGACSLLGGVFARRKNTNAHAHP